MNEKQKFIEKICQRGGAIRPDGKPDPKSKEVLRDLNNAVEKLAKEIYSKKVHFIFELIQNAEELARKFRGSKYKDDVPALKDILRVKTDKRKRKLQESYNWSFNREQELIFRKFTKELSGVDRPAEAIESEEDVDAPKQATPSSTMIDIQGENSQTHKGTELPAANNRATRKVDRFTKPTSRQTTSHKGTKIRQSWTDKLESRSKDKSEAINNDPSRRLISYVSPESEDSKNTLQIKKELGDRGEKRVYDDLTLRGCQVKHLGGNNPGYDLEAVNNDTGETEYYEVKSLAGPWAEKGVFLTPTQHQYAKEKGENYFLIVVDNLETDQPTVPRYIRNPVNQITRYGFDMGWDALAEKPERASFDVQTILDLTDDPYCKDLIRYCNENGLSPPEVGYSLTENSGRVIAECELAWEHGKIAYLIDSQLNESETVFSEADWQVVSSKIDFETIIRLLRGE